MKKYLLLFILISLSGCKTGQMSTILSSAGWGGGALLATGYKYATNGNVTKNDTNDIITTANTFAIFGNIAGQATDNYQMHKQLKKLRKRR